MLPSVPAHTGKVTKVLIRLKNAETGTSVHKMVDLSEQKIAMNVGFGNGIYFFTGR